MRTVVPLEEQLRMDAQPELDIQNQLPLINSQPQSPHNHAFAQLVVNAIHDPNASSHNFNPHAHDHALSIQSIIAASKHQQQQASQLAGQQPTWHIPQHSPVMPPQTQQRDLPAASSSRPNPNKRKLDDSDAEDPHPKIRRVVREHVVSDPSRAVPMTTVICLHAAVAQKSYGSEKRFLCPPPVVHIEGPVWQMRQQQLSMSVVSETGERAFEQKQPLDNSMSASFKYLHVTGTAKAKSFQLSLDIAEPLPHAVGAEGSDAPPGRVWATFDSAPVTIISKPSKKTAKTRNISSCILAGGPVSLFNRINSQTVRTKYMTIDQTQLCASNVSWSAFNVNVVRRSQEPPSHVPQPVTYGSEIILTDTQSGISTAPLVIRKVDKGKIALDDGGPVSQMQKIALQRVNQDGTRHYLSASGPLPGNTGAPSAPPGQAGTHPLIFQSPRIREEMKDGTRVVIDEVDDYLCWTIVGISKFQYTFFDAFGPNNSIPEKPITPFPTLFTTPVYQPTRSHALDMTVSNFYYAHPKTQQLTPLDVYLGNIGPLPYSVYPDKFSPLTTISPFVHSGPNANDGPSSGAVSDSSLGSRYITSGHTHTMLIVDLPPLADVIKAIEDEPSSAVDDREGGATASRSRDAGPPRSVSDREDSGIGTIAAPQHLAGRSLPILFIRSADGVGYHSGRSVAVENLFSEMGTMGAEGGGASVESQWLAAAHAAAAADGGLHGWTLRVV